MTTRIHVVANPAAGQPEPVLHTLNQVFGEMEVEWDLSVTHGPGDATAQTERAVSAGADVVAAYGGDGTVMEVANGLLDSNSVLALLPGGTGNVLSVELGIPQDLGEAARLAASDGSEIRRIDVGLCGERRFLLRVGIGYHARSISLTTRELRDRFGKLAYFIAGMQALPSSKVMPYHFIIDGEEIEAEGAACLVENAGSIGLPDVTLIPDTSITDGLLDVVLVRDVDFGALLSAAASIAGLPEEGERLQHWSGREIKITSNEPEAVVVDGEPWGETPCKVEVLPQALGVIVPGSERPGAR
jgi:YegS/Rv2252/BmrU family lipid kinase